MKHTHIIQPLKNPDIRLCSGEEREAKWITRSILVVQRDGEQERRRAGSKPWQAETEGECTNQSARL